MTTRDAAAASAAIDLLSQVNARIREFRAIVLEVAAGRSDVATLLSQANEIESEITARAAEVETLIGENVPAHQWVGSMLRLMNPDGDWGEFIDLLGPAGMNPRGQWEPGAYAVRDVVTRAGSAWIASAPTTSAPEPGADDWSLLVAAGDQGPQGPHISLRISAGWIEWSVVGTTEWFQLLQVADLMSDANPDTIAARDVAVAAAGEVSAAASQVAADKSAVAGDRAAAAASALAAQQAIANPSVAYDLLSSLNADLAHTAGTVGQVLADGVNNGFYVKSGGSGSGAWTKKSGATIPGLDARTTAVEGVASTGSAAASEGLKILTGIFGRLYQKGGVWQAVEEYLGIDKIGRVVGVDFVRPDDVPGVTKGGVSPLVRDRDGDPLIWHDARQRRVRSAGDITDRDERVAGSPAIITAGDNVLAFIGPDGELHRPAATDAPVAYVKSVDDGGGPVQQVFMVDGVSERRITAAAVNCHAPAFVAPGLLRYGRSDGRVAVVRAPTGGIVGGSAIDFVPVYGQSLAVGSSSFTPGTQPVLRYPPLSKVLMFNGGVRAGIDGGGYNSTSYGSLVSAAEDLDGSTQLSDTGMVSFGFGLAREVGRDVLVCSSGVGGTAYAALKKGTTNYNNAIYGVTRAKVLADAAGRALRVPAVHWRQGESDEDKSYADYLGYLDELSADLVTDISGIVSGASPVLVLQQISRMYSVGGGLYELTTPAQAQGYAGLNRSGMICWGPQYIGDFGDQYHGYPETYCLFGSYAAKAIRRHLYDGRPWKPLYVASAVRTGKRIEVTVAGGVVDWGGAIAIDTRRVSDPGRFGVVFRDSTVSAYVASVEVTGRNTLGVYLSAVPTGSSPNLGFGYWATASAGQGRTVGLRTCIRDNDAEGCPVTGIPLHNYLISQKIGVT